MGKRVNKKGTWFDGMGSFGLAILLALSIRWALLEAYVIPSSSMYPTLLIHDHIFVNKLIYGIRVPFKKIWLVKFNDPQRGEVIVFRYPVDENKFFIKRVIGVPGDKIKYLNGQLHVNDEEIDKGEPVDLSGMNHLKDEDFLVGSKAMMDHYSEQLGEHTFSILLRKDTFHRDIMEIKVPDHHYFVMGDNRDDSSDSRTWGFVPMDNVLGRAAFIWLSCDKPLPLVNMLCNPLTLRFSRFFKFVH